MPELIRDNPLAPMLSTTSDDPMMPEKLARAEPPLSTTTPEVAAAGDVLEEEETPTPGDDVTETVKTGAEDKDQTPPWLKALISKTKESERRALREAERANMELKQLKDAIRTMAPVAQPVGKPVMPDESAYTEPKEYRQAMTKYAEDLSAFSARQAIDEYDNQQQQARAQAQMQRQEEERQEFLERGRSKYDDFSELCEVDSLAITPVMFEAAKRSDIGEDVIYHLGSNPKEARRISLLDPVAQVREIDKLEIKLTPKEAPKEPTKDQPVKPPTKAPAPITPLTSTKSASAKKPEQMSTEEYIKWVRAGRPMT